MIANHQMKRILPLAVVTAMIVALGAGTGVAQAATAPVKEIEENHFGWEVNKTTGGRICSVESHNECQPGRFSSAAGGFKHPVSVAGAGAGSSNFYVVDRENYRVQEFEANGKFVLMFGTNVNGKGGDICTGAEESKCQAGATGTGLGQFSEPHSIAVDPTTGYVYVAETLEGGGRRVQGFTPNGEFVLVIGREVNETKDLANAPGTERDVCTEEEVKNDGVRCKAPVTGASTEPGAFAYGESLQSILTVGGPEDLLYVGDEHRVQEFDATAGGSNGHFKGEIPLTSISDEPGAVVDNIAVDQTTGDVYLVYGSHLTESEVIREFDTAGAELKEFKLKESSSEGQSVLAIAVDSTGLLAVSEDAGGAARGSLYEVGPGLHLLTHFASHGAYNIAFNLHENTLYASFGIGASFDPATQEIIGYSPKPVGELSATPGECVAGPDRESDATLDCDLKGEVDPWGVSETSVWFQWGLTPALGQQTEPKVPVASTKPEGEEETPVKVSSPLDGVRPNQTFYEQIAGEDRHVKAPESLTSAAISFSTPSVPPRVIGAPISSLQTPTTAVLFGSLNPEHTLTQYEFQYAPENACEQSLLEAGESLTEACTGMLAASALESPAYGEITAAQEITGLQPATRYRYRLYAVNEKNEGAIGAAGGATLPEGTFQTAPAPAVTALTGRASTITTTSAVISGSVNPDGQPSAYTFEIGIDNGANTRYGTVLSASAGASSEPVEESLELSGLQPGTTYAYRITAHFGDGTIPGSSATGQTQTLTTLGLPAALSSPASLALLSTPAIVFPKEPAIGSVAKKSTRAQQLASALKACKANHKHSKRVSCEKQARRKYGSKSKPKKKR